MNEIILIGYELLTAMLPTVLLMMIFHHIYSNNSIKQRGSYYICLIVFSIYLFGVFHYTGAGTVFDMVRYGLKINAYEINLLPFSDTNIDLASYGLNVVLFIPLGFIMPLIWPDLNKYRYAFILGFSLSLLVEASQLLNIRATDIDDLIVNTIGAVLGMMIFRLFSRLCKYKPVETKRYKYEIVLYVLVVFAVRFFTYNEFSMAKMLYGF